MNGPAPLRLLHLEDDTLDAELAHRALREGGVSFEAVVVRDKKGFEEALRSGGWDAILLDLTLPGYDGWSALEAVKAAFPDIPCLILTGTVGDEKAAETIRRGAYDFLLKGNPARLPLALTRAVREARDLAERRRLAAEAEAMQAMLKRLLQASPVAVYSAKAHGDFGATFITENIKQQLGYEPAEFTRDPRFWLDRIHPEDAREVRSALERLSAGGEAAVEYRFRAKDGVWRRMLDRMRLVRGPGGEAEIAGYWVDVTVEREFERSLSESEAKFKALVESMRDALVSVDAEGRVFTWNPAAERIFGWTRAEILGKSLELLIPAGSREKHRRGFKELAGTGRSKLLGSVVEVSALRKDGSEFPVELSLWRWEFLGSPLFTALVRDISESKKVKEAYLHAQKMESVGRLAGGVAHDFNNLLTAILGFSGFAAGSLAAGHPALEDLAEIRLAAERAAALTRQLLLFSRRQAAQSRHLDLGRLVREMEKMLRRVLGEEVRLSVKTEAACSVYADPGRLEQVLLNLCVNAKDAMPGGGGLDITTGVERLDETGARGVGPGDFAFLSVRDTGTGMTPEVLSRIFEPFYTTKEEGRGTGLGLATSFGIVKEAGGFIRVESVPGKGSHFRVYLPAAAEGGRGEKGPEPGEVRGGTEALLLVEDEASLRALACRHLRGLGYQVIDRETGEEGLRAAEEDREKRLRLLVSDVRLPGRLSGRDLAEALASLRPDMGVLLTSGHGDLPPGEEGPGARRFPMLRKPYTPQDLAAKIRESLDGRPDSGR